MWRRSCRYSLSLFDNLAGSLFGIGDYPVRLSLSAGLPLGLLGNLAGSLLSLSNNLAGIGLSFLSGLFDNLATLLLDIRSCPWGLGLGIGLFSGLFDNLTAFLL